MLGAWRCLLGSQLRAHRFWHAALVCYHLVFVWIVGGRRFQREMSCAEAQELGFPPWALWGLQARLLVIHTQGCFGCWVICEVCIKLIFYQQSLQLLRIFPIRACRCFLEGSQTVIESYNSLSCKGPQRTFTSNHPCRGLVAAHQIRLPRAPSSLALNASRDGASAASWCSLHQCLTTL